MKLNDLKILFEETFGVVILVGKPKGIFRYVDGKKTDELECIGYPVISTKTWDKITMKVKEKAPSVTFSGKPLPVTFTNVEVKLWQDFRSNEIKISATADDVEEVTTHAKIKMVKGDD